MNTGGYRMASKPVEPDPKRFIEKLNKDTSFRNKFLDHPASTLKKYGFTLEPEDERKVEEAVGYLRDDIKHMFDIPAGYRETLEKLGFGIKMPPAIEVEPTDRMINI